VNSLPTILVVALLIGAWGCETRRADDGDRIPLGVVNPRLKSAGSHVDIAIAGTAERALQPGDLSEIAGLVGRIPGLPEYRILSAYESPFGDGLFCVDVPHFRIWMKKDAKWTVVQITTR
jgi:hypothetical protein